MNSLRSVTQKLPWINAARRMARTSLTKFEISFASIFARWGWSASVYYTIFSRSFDREHKAVLQGRIQHLKDSGSLSAKRFLLRRNTHRLEKGLIMRPRKKIFAKDYIEETVSAYESVVAHDVAAIRSGEIQWFSSVLSEYFNCVSDDQYLQRRKQRFEKALPPTSPGSLRAVPYESGTRQPPRVSYEDFLALCKRRRSVRWFDGRKVAPALLDQAVLAAREAPSACNRQPFEFRIFVEPELVKQVGAVPMGTRGFSDNFPALVVLVGKLDAYPFERDRHVIYIDASLAAMQFMLAAETLGLSTCPINWPDIENREKQMTRLLRLQSYERPIMLMAVGYPAPDGGIPFSEKSSIDVLRCYS